MRFALGCAFNTNEIFQNFPYKKLKITCKECKSINNNIHRDVLVKQVFKECVKLIIEDVIENNITFWLPSRKANIHMQRFTGEGLKNLRRAGKWKSVDLFESMFSAYLMSLYMFGNRTPRIKYIYLNKKYRDRITEKTNSKFRYGDGKVDKTLNDYYEIMYKKFPEILKSDIKRIMNFGWKSLYLHNSYGGDTLIKDDELWFYIGRLKKKPLDHFSYYIKKLSVKLRVLYKRKKIPWDGYYYFALTNSQYENYLSQIHKRGRPKKKFEFENIMMYRILDECKINESGKKYIFKVCYETFINYKFFIRKTIMEGIEHIITRDPLKFKDILIYTNDYEFL